MPDGQHFQRSASCCLDAAYLSSFQGTHRIRGVVNLLPALEADLVGLLLDGEGAGQPVMPATKQNLIEEIEDGSENFHNGLSCLHGEHEETAVSLENVHEDATIMMRISSG